MKRYIGTKIIEAAISERQGPDGQFGYDVVYPDGYKSWSPNDAFEEAYRECNAMTFGLALEAMKKEQYVQRAGWNGKGLKLALVGKGGCYEHGMSEVSTLPYIVIIYPQDSKTTPNAVVPWLASQTDMLAEDWMIVV